MQHQTGGKCQNPPEFSGTPRDFLIFPSVFFLNNDKIYGSRVPTSIDAVSDRRCYWLFVRFPAGCRRFAKLRLRYLQISRILPALLSSGICVFRGFRRRRPFRNPRLPW